MQLTSKFVISHKYITVQPQEHSILFLMSVSRLALMLERCAHSCMQAQAILCCTNLPAIYVCRSDKARQVVDHVDCNAVDPHVASKSECLCLKSEWNSATACPDIAFGNASIDISNPFHVVKVPQHPSWVISGPTDSLIVYRYLQVHTESGTGRISRDLTSDNCNLSSQRSFQNTRILNPVGPIVAAAPTFGTKTFKPSPKTIENKLGDVLSKIPLRFPMSRNCNLDSESKSSSSAWIGGFQ